MQACQSNCNQGRSKCPAPEACQLPDDPIEGAGVIMCPLAVLAIVAVVGFLVKVWP
jgi:hypothetical protein